MDDQLTMNRHQASELIGIARLVRKWDKMANDPKSNLNDQDAVMDEAIERAKAILEELGVKEPSIEI